MNGHYVISALGILSLLILFSGMALCSGPAEDYHPGHHHQHPGLRASGCPDPDL